MKTIRSKLRNGVLMVVTPLACISIAIALNESNLSVGTPYTTSTGAMTAGLTSLAYSTGSMAVGDYNYCYAPNAMTAGTGLTVNAGQFSDCLVIGKYNEPNDSDIDQTVGKERRFVIGNGLIGDLRDAFQILGDGRVVLGETQSDLPSFPFAPVERHGMHEGDAFRSRAWPVTENGSDNLTKVPHWWRTSSIYNAALPAGNGLEPVMFGQLRSVFRKAKEHFDNAFASSGGAGSGISTMDSYLKTATTSTNNCVTIGEVKNLAKLFYDRLQVLDQGRIGTRRYLCYTPVFNTPIPLWLTNKSGEDTTLATMGQVKRAFSFDYDSDLDGDGLPRWWELKYMRRSFDSLPAVDASGMGASGASGVYGASGDFDCDGWTNLQEWNNGTDPGVHNGSVAYTADRVLIVCNSADEDSLDARDYYKANRPGFSSVDSISVNTTTSENIDYTDFVSQVATPIKQRFDNNSNLQFVVFMYGMPTRTTGSGGGKSTPVALFDWFAPQRSVGVLSTFVTARNYADVEGYIDRLAAVPVARRSGDVLIGPGNEEYYFDEKHYRLDREGPDDDGVEFRYTPLDEHRIALIDAFNPDPPITYSPWNGVAILTIEDPRGYQSWGEYNPSIGPINPSSPSTTGIHNKVSVTFSGSVPPEGAWYAMSTVVSYNGWLANPRNQATYADWLSEGAFHSGSSTGYTHSPIAMVTTTAEPKVDGTIRSEFWVQWEKGVPFIAASWAGIGRNVFLPVGDPFVATDDY